jgi:hypothetical protein
MTGLLRRSFYRPGGEGPPWVGQESGRCWRARLASRRMATSSPRSCQASRRSSLVVVQTSPPERRTSAGATLVTTACRCAPERCSSCSSWPSRAGPQGQGPAGSSGSRCRPRARPSGQACARSPTAAAPAGGRPSPAPGRGRLRSGSGSAREPQRGSQGFASARCPWRAGSRGGTPAHHRGSARPRRAAGGRRGCGLLLARGCPRRGLLEPLAANAPQVQVEGPGDHAGLSLLGCCSRDLGQLIQPAQQPVQVSAGVAPVEGGRGLLVAALEAQQPLLECGKIGESRWASRLCVGSPRG